MAGIPGPWHAGGRGHDDGAQRDGRQAPDASARETPLAVRPADRGRRCVRQPACTHRDQPRVPLRPRPALSRPASTPASSANRVLPARRRRPGDAPGDIAGFVAGSDRRGRPLPILPLARRCRAALPVRRPPAPVAAAGGRDPAPRDRRGRRVGTGHRAPGHRRRPLAGGAPERAGAGRAPSSTRWWPRGATPPTWWWEPTTLPPSASTDVPASSRPPASSSIRAPSRCCCSGIRPAPDGGGGPMSTPVVGVVALVVAVVRHPAGHRRRPAASTSSTGPGRSSRRRRPVPYLGGVAVLCRRWPWVPPRAGPPSSSPWSLATALGVADDGSGLPPRRAPGRAAGRRRVRGGHRARPPARRARRRPRRGRDRGGGQRGQLHRRARPAGRRGRRGGRRRLRPRAPRLRAASWPSPWPPPWWASAGTTGRRPASTSGTAAPTWSATALCVLLAEAWAPGRPTATGVAALALVAVPAAEVAFAVVRRLRGGGSLMTGDRGHPYDRLVARGWPRLAASGAYIGDRGGAGRRCAWSPPIPGPIGCRRVRGPGRRRAARGRGGRRRCPRSRRRGRDVSRIYLSPPDVGPEERRMLLEAFDSNWIAPVGPDLDAFEARAGRPGRRRARRRRLQRQRRPAPGPAAARGRARRRRARALLHLRRHRGGGHLPRRHTRSSSTAPPTTGRSTPPWWPRSCDARSRRGTAAGRRRHRRPLRPVRRLRRPAAAVRRRPASPWWPTPPRPWGRPTGARRPASLRRGRPSSPSTATRSSPPAAAACSCRTPSDLVAPGPPSWPPRPATPSSTTSTRPSATTTGSPTCWPPSDGPSSAASTSASPAAGPSTRPTGPALGDLDGIDFMPVADYGEPNWWLTCILVDPGPLRRRSRGDPPGPRRRGHRVAADLEAPPPPAGVRRGPRGGRGAAAPPSSSAGSACPPGSVAVGRRPRPRRRGGPGLSRRASDGAG